MTRREQRLVEALVGGRTVWVDGVALAAVGSMLRGTRVKAGVTVAQSKSVGKVGAGKNFGNASGLGTSGK